MALTELQQKIIAEIEKDPDAKMNTIAEKLNVSANHVRLMKRFILSGAKEYVSDYTRISFKKIPWPATCPTCREVHTIYVKKEPKDKQWVYCNQHKGNRDQAEEGWIKSEGINQREHTKRKGGSI